ncbi:hypothetical protein J6836_08485 [Providencia sp. R33]|uniref:hypothetical protein n=1 Tax=Providencia sp. R33 TaxID=2828763 RepID=UPI001C5B0B47|nr:hypothetical protein [Providencia sp. R33]QXX84395.1 hypothetical protein J6836_08485 [Providencia sp. R33]
MLKRRVLPITLCMLFGLLVGCDTKTPNCSSEETRALVQQVALRELARVPQDSLDSLQIRLNAIRTQSHDQEQDSYSCAADLTFTRFDRIYSKPIVYTVQMVDNEQQFYVQVYGL